jgi:hypothetical protein
MEDRVRAYTAHQANEIKQIVCAGIEILQANQGFFGIGVLFAGDDVASGYFCRMECFVSNRALRLPNTKPQVADKKSSNLPKQQIDTLG